MSTKDTKISIDNVRSRPRFKVMTEMSKAEFLERFSKRLEKHHDIFFGYIGKESTAIGVKRTKDKFYCPYLQVRVEYDEEEESTVIRGLFGPRSSIWTLFTFLYSLGFTFLFLEFILWVSNFIVKVNALFFIGLPIGLMLISGTFLAAKFGQRLAINDMRKLRRFMEYVLKKEKIVDNPPI